MNPYSQPTQSNVEAEEAGDAVRDDGGPAFACAGDSYSGSGGSDGASLRDYFAAKAMQVAYHWHFREAVHPSDDWLPNKVEVAAQAYEMADAMLKARRQ